MKLKFFSFGFFLVLTNFFITVEKKSKYCIQFFMTLSETGSDSSGPDQRPDCVGGGVKAEAGVFIDYWCFYYRSKDMKPF